MKRAPSARTAVLAILLALGMSAATLTVPTVSVLATSLITEFGITRAQLGVLVVASSSVAAAASPLAGVLCDRFGGNRMLLVIHGLAVLSLVSVAIAPGYAVLLVAAAIAGLGTGAGNQATNTVLASALPAGRRGAAMGFKQSGVQVSVLLAGVLLPMTLGLLGWRGAAAVMVVVPVVGAGLTWRVLGARRPAGGRARPHSVGRFRHDTGVRRVAIYAVCMGIGTSTTLTFIALYAQEAIGLTLVGAGAVVSVLGASGAAMRVAWGVLSERTRTYSTPLLVLALLAMAACAVIWSASVVAPTPAVAGVLLIVGAFVAGTSIMSWNAVANLVAVARGGDHNIGRASGLVNLGFLAGYALGPLIFGWSVDVTGSYDAGWAGLIVAFAAAAGVAAHWGRTERVEV